MSDTPLDTPWLDESGYRQDIPFEFSYSAQKVAWAWACVHILFFLPIHLILYIQLADLRWNFLVLVTCFATIHWGSNWLGNNIVVILDAEGIEQRQRGFQTANLTWDEIQSVTRVGIIQWNALLISTTPLGSIRWLELLGWGSYDKNRRQILIVAGWLANTDVLKPAVDFYAPRSHPLRPHVWPFGASSY